MISVLGLKAQGGSLSASAPAPYPYMTGSRVM
uniref:Uncharacterized protein n=1 Tax=Arundo donax TaxID=35708 RepID=A0A0A8ZGK1_ARUDO